jgi:hypothetical protein
MMVSPVFMVAERSAPKGQRERWQVGEEQNEA